MIVTIDVPMLFWLSCVGQSRVTGFGLLAGTWRRLRFSLHESAVDSLHTATGSGAVAQR